MTACLIFITEMDLATFSGSSQSTDSGLPVFTPQNPHDLVQIFPKIINVAVPSPQHSPMLGQLPDEQIVFSLYLSTRPLISEYFFPVGNFTLIQSGFFLKSDLRCSRVLLVLLISTLVQFPLIFFSKIFVLNAF